ncbi:hypothetical protein V6N11_039310 [Hibiscus sabdariffa]|uniref:Uncharacterized protein n=1 Tax=Hibiscus sabdariffa TaxID=183260 RepID=A0ABR2SMI7_9ROSI
MTSKASFKHPVDDPKSSSSIASSEYETTEHGVQLYIIMIRSSNSMDSLQSENTMAGEHSCDLSKVKPESVGNIPRVGSKSSFKHLNDDYKSSNSTGSLKYEKLVPGVMQLNNRTGSLYAEAKQSFTNTENNDESDERSFLAWLWSFALEETCMLSDKDNLEGTFQSKLPDGGDDEDEDNDGESDLAGFARFEFYYCIWST